MAAPEAWVRTVGWRTAANHLRHLRVAARRGRERPEPGVTSAPGVDNVALVSALRRIDAGQRQALVLHYMLDLPVEQVAEEAGVSVSAVKARLVRGRAALAVLLNSTEETSHAGNS